MVCHSKIFSFNLCVYILCVLERGEGGGGGGAKVTGCL